MGVAIPRGEAGGNQAIINPIAGRGAMGCVIYGDDLVAG